MALVNAKWCAVGSAGGFRRNVGERTLHSATIAAISHSPDLGAAPPPFKERRFVKLHVPDGQSSSAEHGQTPWKMPQSGKHSVPKNVSRSVTPSFKHHARSWSNALA
jgi:hypothetical protein